MTREHKVAKSAVMAFLLLGGAPSALAGAWGFGSFENDDALDWVADLERASGLQLIDSTLRHIDTKAKSIEAPDCSLAASEVVAAARGSPAKTVPSEVSAWITRVHPIVSAELLAAARSAVAACRDGRHSELRELWQDSKDARSWLNDTANLLQRLK